MGKYLGEVKLLTTACCIKEMEELRSLNPGVYGALMITKTFPIYKCGHKEAVSANQCILEMVSGKNHLMVATQDSDLRSQIRSIAGVPLIYLHGNCPTLEKPSGLTTKFVEKSSEDKLFTSHQEQTIKQLKKQVFGEPEPSEIKKQKKAGDKLNGVKDKLETQGKRRKKKKKKNLSL